MRRRGATGERSPAAGNRLVGAPLGRFHLTGVFTAEPVAGDRRPGLADGAADRVLTLFTYAVLVRPLRDRREPRPRWGRPASPSGSADAARSAPADVLMSATRPIVLAVELEALEHCARWLTAVAGS
jgi:hypothetical protein